MPNAPSTRRPIIERTSTAILFLFVIFGIGLGVGALLGKFRPPKPSQLGQGVTTRSTTASTDRSVFAVGDRIQIVMSDLSSPDSKMTKTYTVDAKGVIPIPLLGSLLARGHTAAQLEDAIAQAYRDKNLVANMQVTVSRATPQSAPPAQKP